MSGDSDETMDTSTSTMEDGDDNILAIDPNDLIDTDEDYHRSPMTIENERERERQVRTKLQARHRSDDIFNAVNATVRRTSSPIKSSPNGLIPSENKTDIIVRRPNNGNCSSNNNNNNNNNNVGSPTDDNHLDREKITLNKVISGDTEDLEDYRGNPFRPLIK